jgi:predicted glycogen debranching enzyme
MREYQFMPDSIVRRMPWNAREQNNPEPLLSREWLVANGLGGYSSGTVAGAVTRRYHGVLVAALPAPLGRIVMLSHLGERITMDDGSVIELAGEELSSRRMHVPGFRYLTEFRLEAGLPVWSYTLGDTVLEKRIVMPHQQNTVHVGYRVVKGSTPIRLELRPSVHFRPQEAAVDKVYVSAYTLTIRDDYFELSGSEDYPPLRMKMHGERASFTIDRRKRDDIFFRLEEARGYPSVGEHWSPGAFCMTLVEGKEATLVASTEDWDVARSLNPQEAYDAESCRRRNLLSIAHPAAQQGMAAEMVLAADQFIITPAGRVAESARARAVGQEAKTVIAGYHWFTDWGRDTMISLEGLTIATGREREAGYILRTFASYVRDGLIPNMFPEHDSTGLYHTADATLWFFHALHRYVRATNDRDTLRAILPKLLDIVGHHLKGTRFNIGIDPEDGLLRQGQEGYQLTWMDAKVGDWVVTPRRGKTVELNALWYNALMLLHGWVSEEQGSEAAQWLLGHAEKARASFNRRFWYEEGGYLYDVIDCPGEDDTACRPNQIFSVALDHPVLEPQRWTAVVETVGARLLTPVGLRSLAPGHPDYKPSYAGDLVARDAAYHQGTVWGWLIGPYIDAWLKVNENNRAGARRLLEGFEAHLEEAGLGTISEIFDAEPPYQPRGCMAQAWSVAEVLRCWVKTAPQQGS